MSKAPEPQRILQEPAFAALKHAIIERTGLSYYQDKDEALATAIVRSLDDGPWTSVGVFLAEISQPGSLRMDRLTEELTIGETFFFRHTEMFSALREHVFPDLHRRKREQRRLRIWSAGCSIGAEPYSLAILLRTDLAHLFEDWSIEIVGTDINRRFLALAREAAYDPWALRGLSPEMVRRSFTRRGKKWVLHEQFREAVTFQQHNLVRDEFPSLVNSLFSLDLIVCRNVMIYFDQPTLVRLAEQFHQTLVPGGWLAVGHAEPSISVFRAFQTINTAGAILYHREDANARIPKSDGFVPTKLPPVPDLSPPVTPPPTRVPTARASGRKLPRKDAPSSNDQTAAVRAMANRGDVARATEACERLLHLQPMDPALHLFHALLLEQMGQLDLALAAVRRALYLDRRYALAHYHYGVMLQRAGRGRQARTAWKNVEDALGVSADDAAVEHGDGLTAGDLRSLIAMHRKNSPACNMSSPKTINWNAVRARLAENERRLQEVLQPTPDAVAEILGRRAAALRTRRSEAAVKTVPVLIVTAGEDRLALPATAVTEIVKIESLTPVPGALVLGIVTVRGEIIAVLSAGRSIATAGDVKWAVSLRHPRLRVALACTGIEQMVDVPETDLAAATPGEVMRIQAEMALLLDTAVILQRLEAARPPQFSI